MKRLAAVVLACALGACTVTVELDEPGPDAGAINADAYPLDDADTYGIEDADTVPDAAIGDGTDAQ